MNEQTCPAGRELYSGNLGRSGIGEFISVYKHKDDASVCHADARCGKWVCGLGRGVWPHGPMLMRPKFRHADSNADSPDWCYGSRCPEILSADQQRKAGGPERRQQHLIDPTWEDHRRKATAPRREAQPDSNIESEPESDGAQHCEVCRICGSSEPCDCQERINCTKAGRPGHHGCGLCTECNTPRFQCGHLTWNSEQRSGDAGGSVKPPGSVPDGHAHYYAMDPNRTDNVRTCVHCRSEEPETAAATIEALTAWKNAAMEINEQLQLHTVADLLGMKVGDSISKNLLPKVRTLTARVAELEVALVRIQASLAISSGLINAALNPEKDDG